jgi:hypothetical protein
VKEIRQAEEAVEGLRREVEEKVRVGSFDSMKSRHSRIVNGQTITKRSAESEVKC